MENQDTIYDVVGIGNAIVDVLAKVGDGFLTERNLPKGIMSLVEAQKAGEIYNDILPEREVSGGSAANTVAALASLGADCAFIGKIHDDEMGHKFRSDIGRAGIDMFTAPLTAGPATARSIVLVTPDAERSMFTYLGASKKLSVDDIDENIIKASRFTFIEGYLWDEENAKQAVLKACEIAHKYGRQVAFTLSDKSYLQQYRLEMLDLIKKHIDIVFGNEEEIKALFDNNDFETCLDNIKTMVSIAAITRNAKGSVVVEGRTKIFIEAEEISKVVDTTGAGDAYAAGFLYGLSKGRSLGTCALIGGIAAAEIIGHYGARPDVSLRGYVRTKLLQYGKHA